MSVDRYLAIYLHLRYEQLVTVKKTRKVVLCLWLISSLPSVIMVFDQAMTSYLVMTLIIAVCLVIISFVWIKIYQVVRHHQAQIQDQMGIASQSFNITRFRNSVINTILVFLIVLVCYTPLLVSNIFFCYKRNSFKRCLARDLLHIRATKFFAESICVFLASAWSSCTN